MAQGVLRKMGKMELRQEHLLQETRENICLINGSYYATGHDGKGLYELVDPKVAYFEGEGRLIDESFRLSGKNTPEAEITARVKELGNQF